MQTSTNMAIIETKKEMSKMAKISIIVPIYNTEDYLRRCLNSLKNQTEKDIEFILIDDASNDNSLEIMEDYQKKDPRFKIITNSKNQGVSIARNKGIEQATGQYIGFVDSDDYLDLDYYEKLLEAINQKKAPISISETALLGSFEAGEVVDFEKDKITITLGGAYCWQRLFERDLIGTERFIEHCRFEDIAFTFFMQMKAQRIIIGRNTKYHYCRDNQNCFNYINKETPQSVLDLFKITNYLKEKVELPEYAIYENQVKDINLSYTLMVSDLLDSFLPPEECSPLVNHLDALIAKKYKKELMNYHIYSDFDTLFKYRDKKMQKEYLTMEEKECEDYFKTKIKAMIKK